MIRHIPRSALYTAVRLLSLVALVFASALAVDYYFNANTFCNPGASCEIVAKSEFGQKYGIFLPTLGLVAYSFFFLTSFFFAKTKRRVFGMSLSTFWAPLAMICCAVGALLFVVVQAMEIHAFCYLCMGIDTAALLMVIPAILLFLNRREESDAGYASFLHPVLWLGLYVLAAVGPLTWGTFQPQAVQSKAPDYIQSFHKAGKINVVEISSFDCPHCRELHPLFSKLLAEYGDKIEFTRLTIPLGQRKEACIAYYCAELQKKQNAFAECMFEDPRKDAQSLLNHAKDCSIEENSFMACLNDPKSLAIVEEQLKKIQSTGFKGAPTVWIEDTEIIGFDASKGMTPYRNAIENRELALHAKYPLAFLVTVGFALFLLLGGGILTAKRKRRTLSGVENMNPESGDKAVNTSETKAESHEEKQEELSINENVAENAEENSDVSEKSDSE